MNLSFWEKEQFFSEIDVLIIGSGIVGLNAALRIKEKAPTLKVAIAERGVLPAGASTKNAGFACFGSVSELLSDLQEHSEEEVWQILRKRYEGLKRLRSLVPDAVMDYHQYGNFELFRAEDANLFERCSAKIEDFNYVLKDILGEPNVFEDRSRDIQKYGFQGVEQLLWNKAEGQINTGKMMRSLLQRVQSMGIDIYNGMEIKSLDSHDRGVEVQTVQGWSFNVAKVLVATNGFAKGLLEELDVQPARNQVLLTEEIPQLPIRGCFHYDEGYVYFRNIGNRILLGGGRNLDPKGETTTDFGFTLGIQKHLKNILEQCILPGRSIKIEQQWSGILGVGKQKKPIVKQVDKNLAVAVRMGGMGVAIGSLIGSEGADILLKEI